MNAKRLKTILAVVLTIKLVAVGLALVLYLPGDPSGERGGPALALAQEKKPAKPAKADKAGKDDGQKASPATAAKEAAGGNTASTAGTATAAKAKKETETPAYDPQLLKLIEDKRRRLAMDEERLARERRELMKLRSEVSQRINDLKKVQGALEDLLRAENAQRAARIERLVKVIQNMRPASAGALVSKLDDSMAVEIFRRMQSRAAGQVMANLDPSKAARISILLSGEKDTAGAAALAAGAAQRGMQPPPKKEEKPPVVYPPGVKPKKP